MLICGVVKSKASAFSVAWKNDVVRYKKEVTAMKTEPRVLMVAGCSVDYVASGNVSLRLMAKKVEHKKLWMIKYF